MASRFDTAKQLGYYRKITDDDAENDRLAHEAECFFARVYGLPEPAADLGKPDDGWDFLLPSHDGHGACTVDVKWTRYATGGLYVPVHKPLKSLAYVLITGVDWMSIRGFASRTQVRAAPVIDRGTGPGYYLRQSELRSVDRLMAAYGYAR